MIRVEGLTKRFHDITAVDGVSFDVKAGETFVLLGPNGSGKTTTLKCLVGLCRPSSGSIKLGGVDALREGQRTRRLISYLPQRVSFNDSLTAREVLEFYCRLRKTAPARIDQVLSRSRLNGFSDRPVGEFSGGMVQRLGLAVACLPEVPVLILDEPTISLDPEGAIRFREVLLDLKREGKTIVISTHVLADVDILADRVGILVGGKLVSLKGVDELRDELLVSGDLRITVHNPQPDLARVALAAGADEATLEEGFLLVRSKPERRLQVLRAVEESGVDVRGFSTREPSLEDFYLRYLDESEVSGK